MLKVKLNFEKYVLVANLVLVVLLLVGLVAPSSVRVIFLF